MRRIRTAIAAATLLPISSLGQIVLDNTITPTQAVVDVLLGQGVTVSNITFNGQPGNLLNEQIGGFDATNAILGINEGVIIATGSIGNAVGPNNSGSSSLGGGNFGQTDPDLVLLSGNPSINDAGILEFDFVPTGDSLKFDFIFASEEYLEFVNSVNDAFGFFISGPGINGPYQNNAINIALVPGTTQPVTINDVNSTVNSTYYVDNGDGWTAPYNTNPQYVQYDGHTVVMTAKTEVTCGVTYHIKICIGDASDTAWDSAVFLQAGSFTSSGQVVPELSGDLGGIGSNDSTLFEGCGIIPLVFHRYGDTTNVDTVNLIIGGTATGGVDYSPAFPVQLIYQPGDTIIPWPVTVPLDADGLETITIGIAQNIVCSGQQILNEYVLYIDQYPALNVVTNDVDGDCGGQYTLTPVITGGTGLAQILWDTGETTTSITVSPGVTTTYDFTVT
ncbi:MAG TPA: choice-of-anchor L domain-containing protein, partial [Flavobacteriales bacterium]|nr:choice-of-anchor L domain-containing protein [Flavobacteriales bacterium]